MLLSMNWIGDFVDLSGLDKKALIHRFTLSTAEVEDIIEKGTDTYGVIVAKIASVENHPNSKKLHLLKIDTGARLVDCVCGAPNVREGMKVAFAQAGGAVAGHPIGEATVAGYPSFGMCCSEAELGISADNSGLFEILDDIPLGTDLKSVYDIEDILFEVDNKSLTNRPDLWGHFGVAREFSALAGRPLRAVPGVDTSAYDALPPVAIEILDTEHAYRYVGVKVENIGVHTSPVNMRIRLYYCGSRAINLLADLTNYVMLELGQPMHAFDLRRVDRVEVRRFDASFSFDTLDGQSRPIDENTLMITSGGTPVAVAGIMGGLASEIEDDTTSLLLESACFDGISIRRSSARLGLRTDASMRYEKMLDPELCLTATARFLDLLLSICPVARVTSAVTDCYKTRYPAIEMTIDKAYVDRYTGIDISSDRIENTLVSLGFGVDRTGDAFRVTVPSWRATKDVTIPADLIEEITRIYGYDNFEIFTAKSKLAPVLPELPASDEAAVKTLLVERFSLHEVHSYIWCDAPKYREIGIEIEENVRILNPGTPDHAVLRNSMTPTLLSFLAENRGISDSYGLFEVGRVVKGKRADGDCNERRILGIAVYSREESEETVFLRVRDMLTSLVSMQKHVAPIFSAKTPDHAFEHPVNTFAVTVGGVECGTLSVPHPTVATAIDKKAAIAFAELDMDLFSSVEPSPIRYREASRFPGIDIDMTFAATLSEVDYVAVSRAAMAAGSDLLAGVGFVGNFARDGEETITLRFSFVSAEKTLSKPEVSTATEEIAKALASFGLTAKH